MEQAGGSAGGMGHALLGRVARLRAAQLEQEVAEAESQFDDLLERAALLRERLVVMRRQLLLVQAAADLWGAAEDLPVPLVPLPKAALRRGRSDASREPQRSRSPRRR